MNPVARALGVAGGMALGGLAAGVALVVAVVSAVRAVGVDPSPAALLVLSLLLVQGVTFGGVGLAYFRARGRSPRSLVASPTVRDLAVAAAGYVLALGAAVAGAVAVSFAGLETGRNVVAEAAIRNPDLLLLLVPASFLLVGPGEELLFRGVVQGRLRETLSAPAAVVLAAALFAAVHFVALSGSVGARLVTVLVLFGPALVFGTAYEVTDNLVVPALIHGAYNATLFSLLYVSLRFAGGPGP
ncbi:MAG: lysostaphin resistance A-like protein [Haloferacaceae archaeon]